MFAFFRKLFRRVDHLGLLKALMPELKDLDRKLRWCAEHNGSPLHQIVEFFQIVSKWHDREFNAIYKSLEGGGGREDVVRSVVRTFTVLCTHFQDAGRSPYGWNRTELGETVTADKVFLGNIFGLFTHPVSYWLTLPLELRQNELTHPLVPEKSPRQLVEAQARDFTEYHIREIREAIATLNCALQPKDKRATVRPISALA